MLHRGGPWREDVLCIRHRLPLRCIPVAPLGRLLELGGLVEVGLAQLGVVEGLKPFHPTRRFIIHGVRQAGSLIGIKYTP